MHDHDNFNQFNDNFNQYLDPCKSFISMLFFFVAYILFYKASPIPDVLSLVSIVCVLINSTKKQKNWNNNSINK